MEGVKQNGWNEYSKLVLAELERLDENDKEAQKKLEEINGKLAELLLIKDEFKAVKKDVSKLNTFRTAAITIWAVVQVGFTAALAIFKT